MEFQGLAVMRVVFAAILPLRLELPTHFNVQIRCDGYVTQVEKLVKVRAEKEPIVDAVLTF